MKFGNRQFDFLPFTIQIAIYSLTFISITIYYLFFWYKKSAPFGNPHTLKYT